MGFIVEEVLLKTSFGGTDEEDDRLLGFGPPVTCELAVIHLRVRICFEAVEDEAFLFLCSVRASSERGGAGFCGEGKDVLVEVVKWNNFGKSDCGEFEPEWALLAGLLCL